MMLRRHVKEMLATLGLIAVGLLVGGYILSQQTSFAPPSWVPFAGEDPYVVEAEFSSAQAVVPGQGQAVTVAGVRVGLVGDVTLRDGRAIVRMDIDRDQAPVYRDARIVLRPRTPLRDMYLALERGTRAAGRIPDGGVLPVARTTPDVPFDEVLATLDADTRAYLQLLLEAAGTGFSTDAEGTPDPAQVDALRGALRRFDPLARDTRRITDGLARRRVALRRVVSRYADVAAELGSIEDEITTWVGASNASLAIFARRDDDVRSALRRFPGALRETTGALRAATPLAGELRTAATALRPFARTLLPAQAAARDLSTETTPVVRDELRPFAREVAPLLRTVRPGTQALADVLPGVSRSVRVIGDLFKAVGYNPGGPEEGYLFWTAWVSHIGASLAGLQDAHGPMTRTMPLVTCSQLEALAQIEASNETLEALIKLSTLPDRLALCPGQTPLDPVVPPGTPPAATPPAVPAPDAAPAAPAPATASSAVTPRAEVSR